MKPRLRLEMGQAAVDWLIALTLVAVLAALCHNVLFAPIRSIYRWAADCVTVDQCDP